MEKPVLYGWIAYISVLVIGMSPAAFLPPLHWGQFVIYLTAFMSAWLVQKVVLAAFGN